MTKVLFLEDEKSLANTLPAVLRDIEDSLDVISFTDIDEALTRLKKEVFDAVLLDISMPPTNTMDSEEIEHGWLTGIAVTRDIKAIRQDIPIIALTGRSDPVLQEKMRQAGIDRIINKPSEPDNIAQVLLKVTQ